MGSKGSLKEKNETTTLRKNILDKGHPSVE